MGPMFPYYGSKFRLAKHIGQPKRDLVIEPFAGGANYSLYWNCRQVKLYDIAEEVCILWDYLINCSEQDIRNLPDYVRDNDHLFEYSYPEERLMARWIWYGAATTTPKNSDLAEYKKNTQLYWRPKMKQRIIEQKPLIKNWTIENISYKDIPDLDAHYYVDPPYQDQMNVYGKDQTIDYAHLSHWCETRTGSVAVSEQEGASWLPFAPLREKRNMKHGSYTEVIWTKEQEF